MPTGGLTTLFSMSCTITWWYICVLCMYRSGLCSVWYRKVELSDSWKLMFRPLYFVSKQVTFASITSQVYAFNLMPLNIFHDNSTLIQVMAFYRQETSHYPKSQCWPRSVSPHGVTRPQWFHSLIHIYRHHVLNQYPYKPILCKLLYCIVGTLIGYQRTPPIKYSL